MERPKNDKLARLDYKKTIWIAAAAAAFTALLFLVRWAGRTFPAFVENVYQPFSKTVMRGLAYATGWLPFSVAEVLLYAGVALLITLFVRVGYVLITGRRRAAYLLRALSIAAFAASASFLLFYLLWGLNYNAKPLAEKLRLPVRERTPSELAELSEFLLERANTLASELSRENTGTVSPRSVSLMAKEIAREFGKTTGRAEPAPKFILASVPLSYTRTAGIFVPFTGEANFNSNDTLVNLPFTMAHELSHRYGVAREDEANFFAFLVLHDSDDKLYAYSAYLTALRYCQNGLSGADYDAYTGIALRYNAQVRFDINESNSHWAQYEGKVAQVSSAVNDAYLVSQGQEDGEKSYGRIVDLLLAWYQENK